MPVDDATVRVYVYCGVVKQLLEMHISCGITGSFDIVFGIMLPWDRDIGTYPLPQFYVRSFQLQDCLLDCLPWQPYQPKVTIQIVIGASRD